MKVTQYHPNFNDPRVIKKCHKVLIWAKRYLFPHHQMRHSSKVLIKVFGPSCNQLSKYLRAKLLHQLGTYKVGEECYAYLLNKEGYDELENMISQTFDPDTEVKKKRKELKKSIQNTILLNTSVHQHLVDEFLSQIKTGSFEYKEKANRSYHPLQNLPRKDKEEFWKDYLPYDYDIEACAPTILYQYAQQCGLLDVLNQSLKDYLEDKNSLRNHISDILDVDSHIAKKIINGLFNGAKLSSSMMWQCSIFKLLDLDKDKMNILQEDEEVCALRRNIKYVWDMIKKFEKGRTTSWSKGDKWKIYFREEKKIMKIIYDVLHKDNVFFFNEHDGFRTNKEIDINKMQTLVKEMIGYEIIIKTSRE